jgi:hypothetical protein
MSAARYEFVPEGPGERLTFAGGATKWTVVPAGIEWWLCYAGERLQAYPTRREAEAGAMRAVV